MRRGSALLFTILAASALLVLAVFLLKMVYNGQVTARLLIDREAAYWLATAGWEKGEAEQARNPGWYTDQPHYPAADLNWLQHGALGARDQIGRGWFKVVREQGSNTVYSLGYRGQAVVILKEGREI